MPHTGVASVWHRLFRDLVEAEKEHDRLQEEIVRNFPNYLPSSDIAADVRQARIEAQKELRAAFERCERAKERFRALVDEGAADDLRDS